MVMTVMIVMTNLFYCMVNSLYQLSHCEAGIYHLNLSNTTILFSIAFLVWDCSHIASQLGVVGLEMLEIKVAPW